MRDLNFVIAIFLSQTLFHSNGKYFFKTFDYKLLSSKLSTKLRSKFKFHPSSKLMAIIFDMSGTIKYRQAIKSYVVNSEIFPSWKHTSRQSLLASVSIILISTE